MRCLVQHHWCVQSQATRRLFNVVTLVSLFCHQLASLMPASVTVVLRTRMACVAPSSVMSAVDATG